MLLDDTTLDHIEKIFAEQGSDAWWKLDEEDLLPEAYKGEATKWKKGTDTMDVWFDSGSSWAGVANARDELQYPADLYLEGSDQHRGWFQSSLLTSVAVNDRAPYKAVLTHGFVLDEKGFKMSKSTDRMNNPVATFPMCRAGRKRALNLRRGTSMKSETCIAKIPAAETRRRAMIVAVFFRSVNFGEARTSLERFFRADSAVVPHSFRTPRPAECHV